jgi:PAS domain S-box-containing protein
LIYAILLRIVNRENKKRGAPVAAKSVDLEQPVHEQMYRTAIEALSEGIVLQDADGVIQACNASAERILGLSQDQMMGRTSVDPRWQAIHEDGSPFPGEDHPAMVTLQTGQACSNVIMGVHKPDGTLAWISINSQPIFYGTGSNPSAVVTSFTDITARMQAEQELRLYLDRLEGLVQERTAELEQSNKELDEYATVTSHDLKSPLTSIIGFAELLEKKCSDQLTLDGQKYVQNIIRNGKRMIDMINALLRLARLKVREEDFEWVDCDEVLAQVIDGLDFTINEEGATITHDSLPKVRGVKELLGQVFPNLIGNAIKFHGPEPPVIHVTAIEVDGFWQFCVKDNGIGFDSEHSTSLFNIFRRLHTQAEYPGEGVGLSICKKIIEHHGGTIWAESQEGQGATFCFTLPMSRE